MSVVAQILTCVNDETIGAELHAAQHRVMFVAPGVSESVAVALGEAWQRLGPEKVRVVLDVDPEACRLGYGTIAGLRVLHDAAAAKNTHISHQPGVRVGILVCDDATFVFTTTPLLIEAGSSVPGSPNGIKLPSVPPELASDLGLDAKPNRDRMVGVASVSDAQIAAVEQDLVRVPPVRFDLARRVRIFTSQFQFVELEMTGCFVSRKRVSIPSNLVGLANKREAEEQFHARFNLVNSAKLEVRENGRVVTEASLAKRKQQIIKSFLTSLKGYGSVVQRLNKVRFLAAVEELREEVRVFQEGITKDLQRHMDDNVMALVAALAPAVFVNPPDSYTKVFGKKIPAERIHQYLERDIRDAFGHAADLVSEMKVTVIFKDVAYESLMDPNFLQTAREAMPEIEFMHEEIDAAGIYIDAMPASKE